MFSLSRFERAVLSSVVGLLLLTGLIIWRGDRVGVQIVAAVPEANAQQVSTQTGIQVIFAQEMAIGSQIPISVEPDVQGTIRWDGRSVSFIPHEALEPATTYTVTVHAGLRSQHGRPFLNTVAWQFQTSQPRILYIAWDEENRNQLYRINPDGSERVQLTNEPLDVLDYALSPDAGAIVYSSLRQDGGSDLWRLSLEESESEAVQLLSCPDAACSGVNWFPDGRRLVYERRSIQLPGAPPGPPRLWLLDLDRNETAPLFQDSQLLGLAPRVSPSGQWLSYAAPLDQEVQVYNVNDGRSLRITSRMGQPAVWHPTADRLLVNDIQFDDDRYAVHLFEVDLATERLVNLSGDGADVSDNLPAWSPDGEWLAVGRKIPRQPMGSQVWVMRADGSEARPLTDNPDIHYGPAKWSLDGRTLLVERYFLTEPGADPGIWLIDVATGELSLVTNEGAQPSWLP